MIQPTRILVLIDTLLAGGAERLAVEIACAVDRTRYQPHVVVTRYSGPLEQLLIDADVPYTVLDRRRRIDFRAWRIARRLARDSDLIHSHKFGSNVWGSLLARSTGVPLVVHEHNFSAEASRFRALMDTRWIASIARRIICVSKSVADVERDLGVPDELIAVVPNGVRLEAAWPRSAARAELGLHDDEYVVGIVGRLRPEKAHEVLLVAMQQLVRARRKVRLCVVGDGPREAELHALAGTLGITRSVTWAGERPDAARLASAFDLSVICSHWEGLPLAALESLAAGVPVISSAVGGLPDLLADGAGSLVAPGDSSGFAGAIAACMDDPDLTRAMAAAGQRRVREEHSFRKMVRRIEGIYAAVLGEQALQELIRDDRKAA